MLSPVNNVHTKANTPVSFTVQASDFSGYTPTFQVTNAGPFGQPSTITAPTNVTVTVTPGTDDTATVTLTPANGFIGTLNLTMYANDSQ